MEKQEKKQQIASHFRAIMGILGLDLNDPSLIKTPDRVAKMYVDEIFYGLDDENFPSIMSIPNDMDCDQMLVERDIKVHSMCLP